MRPVTLKRIGARLLATTALAAFVIAAPVSAKFDNATGTFTLAAAEALAKGENSGSGGGGDNSGSGGGGNSGSGGGGNSGSGGGGGDDHSGGDDDDHSGGDDDDSDDDQDHADDNSGRRGGDNRGNDGGPRVEISGDKIEVTHADGTKEEIENGVYERKNADGRTVEERPATQEDFDRLASTTGGSTGGVGSAPGGGAGSAEREYVLGDGTKVEVAGDDIEVKYSDGWKEEIEAGRYELKDPSGNTVVERTATPGDRTRLQAQLPG